MQPLSLLRLDSSTYIETLTYTYNQGLQNLFCIGWARIIRKIKFWEFSKFLLYKYSILGGPAPGPPCPLVRGPCIYYNSQHIAFTLIHIPQWNLCVCLRIFIICTVLLFLNNVCQLCIKYVYDEVTFDLQSYLISSCICFGSHSMPYK